MMNPTTATTGPITSPLTQPCNASNIEQTAVAWSDRMFAPFPRLPVEIRHEIWRLALPGPRIVPLLARSTKLCPHIWYRIRSDVPIGTCALGAQSECEGYFDISPSMMSDDEREISNHCKHLGKHLNGRDQYQCFRSHCPPPAILSVCRESFEIASKLYSRHFSIPGSHAQTYFNFAIDTLHIDHNTFLSGHPSEYPFRTSRLLCDEAKLIENLSVGVSLCSPYDRVQKWIIHLLQHLRNLKKLTIVDDDYTSFIQSKNMSDKERNVFDKHVGRYKWSVVSVEAREQQIRLYEGMLTAKQRSADLAFVDVVDIGDALTMLRGNMGKTKYHDHNPIAKTVTITDYSCIESAKHADPRFMYLGEAPFKVPLIEHKVLTTTKMKAELDRAWEEYRNGSNCPCLEGAPHPSSAGAARWREIEAQW
ncbi:hypothetical protein ACMFMF_009199 [Clarireedia jacksonii]